MKFNFVNCHTTSIRTGGDGCSNGTLFATFTYDGDGNRVKITMNTTATARFAQADSIIPNPGYPQAWDRYAYVNNNPSRYKDPSGHEACDEDGNCYNAQGWYRALTAPRLSVIDTCKMLILHKYGITMSDAGGKSWDSGNLRLMYMSLGYINTSLNGNLKKLAGRSTFMLGNYQPSEQCPNCTYSGWTSGTSITFYTLSNAKIHQMNIYHEFGHLLDNFSGDQFSTMLRNQANPSYITNDGYLDRSSLIEPYFVNDPHYGTAEAIQHPYSSAVNAVEASQEHWADAFANYVAGNINSSTMGNDLTTFIDSALAPYLY